MRKINDNTINHAGYGLFPPLEDNNLSFKNISSHGIFDAKTMSYNHARSTQQITSQINKTTNIHLSEYSSLKDQVSGLDNRYGFLIAIEQQLHKLKQGLINNGLFVIIDVDNFKSINTKYGHQMGDKALRLVGETLLTHIRSVDIAARIRGDEFVLMLSDANLTEAAARLQKLAKRLNSLLLACDSEVISIRASIAAKMFDKDDDIKSVMNKTNIVLDKTKRKRKETCKEF